MMSIFTTGKIKTAVLTAVIMTAIFGGYIFMSDGFEIGDEGSAADEQQSVNEEAVEEKELAMRVITAEALLDDIEETSTFSAHMQPDNEYAVIPRLEGEIEEIDVEVGDEVEQGERLARLDDERYRAELRQAEAQVDAAEAELKRMERGATPEELEQVRAQVEEARISVEGASQEVDYAREIYEERTPDDLELEQIENELEQARVQLDMAEKEKKQARLGYEEARDNYERMASLYEEGAISEQQYEEVKNARDRAETQLEMAEEGLRQAEIGVSGAESVHEMTEDLYDFRVEEEQMVDQAETQYEAAGAALEGAEAMLTEAERGPTEEELEAARAQVEQARAGLDMARTVHDNTVVEAPADGVIARVEAEEGSMASPETPIAYLINLDEIQATATVNEPHIGTLEAGEKARVEVNALPGHEFTGTISSVAPMSGEEGGFPVEVSVANPDHDIKAGMRGRLELTTAGEEEAVLVPADAVFTPDDGGEDAVFVAEDGRARRQTVTTGIRQNDRLQINSGLSPGKEVILYDHARLEDGMEVEVTENEDF